MIMNDQFAAAIHANVSAALEEDLGSGDKTAELVPATMAASAIIICREPMTLHRVCTCGYYRSKVIKPSE